MKYLLFLILVSFIFALSSCGEDSTTTPNNPVTSDTLYSLALLEAAVVTGSGSNFNSVSFANTITASNVRLEFTIQSNADSSQGCTASYRDSTNGSPVPPSPLTVNVYSPIDTTYSMNLSVPTQPFFISFNVSMLVLNPLNTLRRYMRFVNVRVIKVS